MSPRNSSASIGVLLRSASVLGYGFLNTVLLKTVLLCSVLLCTALQSTVCWADDEAPQGKRFIRGDANMDGRVTLADIFAILRYSMMGSPLPCLSAADTDDNGSIQMTDALGLVGSIMYRHGPLPVPFTKAGYDPTPDLLGCRQGLEPNPGLQELGEGQGAVDEEGGDGDESGDGASGCDDDSGGSDLEFIHFFRGRVLATPGEKVRAPISIVSSGGVEGLTLSLWAAPELIHLDSIDFHAGVLGVLVPEPQWTHNFAQKAEEGYSAASVALSIQPPFLTLPTLHGETLAFVNFTLSPDAPLGSELEILFQDIPGENGLPPLRNEISRKGAVQPRFFCGLKVSVVSGEDVFIRGDVNRDRELNLTDAIHLLRHLFGGAATGALPCPDAADVDDSGSVHLTDAIALVHYLFLRGAVPAEPFPLSGRDPSPDALGCAE